MVTPLRRRIAESLALTHKEIHEARQIRDVEVADHGSLDTLMQKRPGHPPPTSSLAPAVPVPPWSQRSIEDKIVRPAARASGTGDSNFVSRLPCIGSEIWLGSSKFRAAGAPMISSFALASKARLSASAILVSKHSLDMPPYGCILKPPSAQTIGR